MQDLLTVAEAAERIGVSASVARLLVRTGHLPAEALGGGAGRPALHLVPVASLEARTWRTVAEAAAALEVTAAEVRAMLRRGELAGESAADPAAATARTVALVNAQSLAERLAARG